MVADASLVKMRTRLIDEISDMLFFNFCNLLPIMVIMCANFKSYSSINKIVKLVWNQRKEKDGILDDMSSEDKEYPNNDETRYTAVLKNLDLLSLPQSDHSFVDGMQLE